MLARITAMSLLIVSGDTFVAAQILGNCPAKLNKILWRNFAE
jgi:hypothetical protein